MVRKNNNLSGLWKFLILFLLTLICALTVVASIFITNEHPNFPIEENSFFFGIFGFVSFLFIVLIGQHLRKIVTRKEDYYDDWDK